jgi:hypothetical protein
MYYNLKNRKRESDRPNRDSIGEIQAALQEAQKAHQPYGGFTFSMT